MLGEEVVKYLLRVGCCQRCVLIYLGERSDLLYVSSSLVNQAVKKASINLDKQAEDGASLDDRPTEQLPSAVEERCPVADVEKTDFEVVSSCDIPEIGEVNINGNDAHHDEDHVSKKQKIAVCITCIGLLQYGCSSNIIKQISEALVCGSHDADSFTLALALPICLSLRVHRVWTLLKHAFPLIPDKSRADHIGTLKDVWKNLVGPALGKLVNKTFVQGQYLEFIMNVSASYVDDIEDCKILDHLCASMFSIRRKQHKKYAGSVYSKQSVDTVIKKLTDKEFLKKCPEPPSVPSWSVTFTEMKWQRESLYMAGRYNKYSRELPQTPWFVEGERKLGSSVQELLCEVLSKAVKAEDHRFSSSGREDVDVQCLGNGRPFVIEFINPCKTKFQWNEITQLQKDVNESSKLIQIRDLQIVEKKDLKSLKEGEEEKTKAYCALCIARGGFNPAILDCLAAKKDLVIQQKTPIRVLHRRPLLTRPRIIHEMKASRIDECFFKLHMTTQAGTYIKEFVHGDLGRTTPNLKTILGLDVDIIALDVERVALDWPPKCSE